MKQYNRFYHLLYRIRNSLYFRFLCISYAIFLCIFNENYFPQWLYLVSTILYLAGYIYLAYFAKSIKANSIRLLWDYVFIIFISYEKNVTDISTSIFILLPVYNAINFTGNRRSPILLIGCATFSYVFIYYSYFHSIPVFWGFLGLLCIDYYSSIRWKTELISDNLMDIIDDFYSNVKKPHSIYGQAIDQINIVLKKNSVNGIFCFVLNGEAINIVNSSKQVIFYHIDIDSKQMDFLRTRGFKHNITFQYDFTRSEFNYCIYIKSPSNTGTKEYLFILDLSKNLTFYDEFSGVKGLLQTFFTRIAKLLHNESILIDRKRSSMKEIRNRNRFVEQSVNTMHFIRNRLSPYRNLLQLIDERKKASPESQEIIDDMIYSQYKTAENELEQVISKANFLLEKDNNPFNFQELTTCSVVKLVMLIRTIWNEYFKEEDLDLQNLKIEDCYNRRVKTNIEGLELLFSDWISNMFKYRKQYAKCCIYIKEDYFVIDFNNDYLCHDRDLMNLINDLNSDNRKQITRRTTHGLYFIKQVIDDLQIDHCATNKIINGNGTLILTFQFQFVNYE